MRTKYRPKERRTTIDLGTVFCTFDRRISEYIIVDDGEDSYTLESSYTGKWFDVKKDKCFKTKDDLKYNNFCQHCFNLLAGKHADGSTMNVNVSEEFARERLKRFLGHTKQGVYRERFYLDHSEHLI